MTDDIEGQRVPVMSSDSARPATDWDELYRPWRRFSVLDALGRSRL